MRTHTSSPTIVVVVGTDGTGTITGLEPQVITFTGENIVEVRKAVMTRLRQHAIATGQPVRFTATDEQVGKERDLIVHPSGRFEQALAPGEEIRVTHTPPPPPVPAAVPVPQPAAVLAPPVVSLPAARTNPRPSGPGAPGEHSFLKAHDENARALQGWRGWAGKMGMTLAPSAQEEAERAAIKAVSQHFPGPRVIAVVNGKGGANKTPTTALLAAVFARHGGGPVLAWDNNETRGTLGWRTQAASHNSHVLDLIPQTHRFLQAGARIADLAQYVHHQGEDKYDVLRSNPALLASEQHITAEDFDAIHAVANQFYRMTFIDSGNNEAAGNWLRMIEFAHHVVVATTTRPDHAEAGRLLLQALRERGHRAKALADNALVVVSQADQNEDSATEIAEQFKKVARTAVPVPYDPALRQNWIRWDALSQASQRAWLQAAAALAAGL